MTPLMWASEKGHAPAVTTILHGGADPNAMDEVGGAASITCYCTAAGAVLVIIYTYSV